MPGNPILSIPFSLALVTGGFLAASPAQAIAVRIDETSCETITRHVPDADVSYQEGVDVHGNAVAPADLPESRTLPALEQVTVHLLIPLREFFATPPARLDEAEVDAGRIAVDIKSGRLSYNGVPLSDPAQHAIAEECLRRFRQGQ
jgi:hypothetical protein